MHINLMVIYILTVFFHLKLHRRIVDILNNVDKRTKCTVRNRNYSGSNLISEFLNHHFENYTIVSIALVKDEYVCNYV